MKFWEAMKALEEGKTVKKDSWSCGAHIHKGCLSPCTQTDVLLSCVGSEWELYEEPEKPISFAEVVKGLKEGKRFKRTHWDEVYIYHSAPKRGELMVMDSEDNVGARFVIEDFEATDWVEVKE